MMYKNGNGNKKPLPGFEQAKKRIERSGYKSDWINKNIAINEKSVIFIKQKKRLSSISKCPYFEGKWFSSIKCSKCCVPIPGLHLDLTCSRGYEQCPFYKGESIDDYDII